MNRIYTLHFMDTVNRFFERFKDWIVEHYQNPLLWLFLFCLGLIIFQITFSALQKEK